jgi:hypothetical protein
MLALIAISALFSLSTRKSLTDSAFCKRAAVSSLSVMRVATCWFSFFNLNHTIIIMNNIIIIINDFVAVVMVM